MDGHDRATVDRLKAGSAGFVERLERWVTFHDDETCAGCRYLHGYIFFAFDGPQPPQHTGCHCGRLPVETEGLGGVALIRLVLEAQANRRQADFLAQKATRRRLMEREEQSARGRLLR